MSDLQSKLFDDHFRRIAKMGIEIEQPESLGGGGGNFIDKPGVYHLLVTEIDENPADNNGSPLDADLKVTFAVLGGTNPEQKDRTTELTFWKPKEKNDMASKKIARFCLATCLIGAHNPGQRVRVEPKDAVGRQVVAKLCWKQKKNEATGKYEDSTDRVDLHYSDIWHVDDLEVAKNHIPLDPKCIAAIPSVLRKPITAVNQGGNSSGNGGHVQTSPAALVTSQRNGVTTPAVDVSSL